MKFLSILLLVLFCQVSMGAFNLNIKEPQKPTVVVTEAADEGKQHATKNADSEPMTSDNRPIVDKVEDASSNVKSMNSKPQNILAQVNVDSSKVNQIGEQKEMTSTVMTRSGEPMRLMKSETKKNDQNDQVSPEDRFEQLMEIKRQNTGMMQLAQNDAIKPSNKPNSSIFESSQVLKPLLIANKGDSVEETLNRWAKESSFTVIYSLGAWERIKELKMSTDARFDSDFEKSIGMFLDALNGLAQLKSNKVHLTACMYTNRYVEIKANKECSE